MGLIRTLLLCFLSNTQTFRLYLTFFVFYLASSPSKHKSHKSQRCERNSQVQREDLC